MLVFLRAVLLGLFLTLALPAAAGTIAMPRAEVVQGEDSYFLNADVDLELPGSVREAINRGVQVYFVAEAKVERPRWYWLPETIAERSISYRLSYHAITRAYRLSIGNLHQNFETLDEALATMLRIRSWPVVDRSVLKPGEPVELAFRFRLDQSQLPKPFQLSTLTSRDWNLSTDWERWSFTPRSDTVNP